MLKLIYLINIFVAGFLGFISIFNAELASIVAYQKVFPPSPVMQLIGSSWIAIATTSFIGTVYPLKFSPILIFQFFYQITWVVVNFIFLENTIPLMLISALVIWSCLILLSIPWKYLFKEQSLK